MKHDRRAIDPNVSDAFPQVSSTMDSGRASGTISSGRFDGEIPTYVFMRTLAAEDAPPNSVRQSKPSVAPERRPRERTRSEPDLPEIGSILDKYRIEELIGRGGFAVVYRATHLLLRTPVALKLLRPKVTQKDPMFARLLCEEARFAARINHPNVVRVQDVTDTPEITYVVMEFIDGATLARTFEKSGPLPPQRVLRIALEVASGLRAGYEQGLIHRDIKPANILISRAGVTKIVDLGLAYPRDGHHSASVSGGQSAVSTISSRLPVVGTPAYMAPEQSIDADNIDFRADVYSLGVTMFHSLTGELPYRTREPARCIEMHRTHPTPRVESIRPNVPRSVTDLVYSMMSKDPDGRPASYDALIDSIVATLQKIERR